MYYLEVAGSSHDVSSFFKTYGSRGCFPRWAKKGDFKDLLVVGSSQDLSAFSKSFGIRGSFTRWP